MSGPGGASATRRSSENSAEIPRSSFTCDRMAVTHSSRTGDNGRPRSVCTLSRCSADSWMGVRGFLISWATCRAISAQASSRCVRCSSARWRSRSAAIRLKSCTRRRNSSDDVGRMRALRSPRAILRVALVRRLTGSPIAPPWNTRCPRREVRTTVRRARGGGRARRSRGRFLLSRGKWNREDGFTAPDTHGSGRKHVAEDTGGFFPNEARQPIERDGAVDLRRCADGQQAGSKQIALARRQQTRPVEDVHVRSNRIAQPDHEVIVGRRSASGSASGGRDTLR